MPDNDPGFGWFQFYSGADPATSKVVCHLPHDLRKHIGAHTAVVRVRRDYIQKSVHKHGFSFDHLEMLRHTIQYGEVYENTRRQLVFFYQDNAYMKNYLFVALKSIHSGSDIWVKSFHWKDDRDRKRILKKSTLIRPKKA